MQQSIFYADNVTERSSVGMLQRQTSVCSVRTHNKERRGALSLNDKEYFKSKGVFVR